MIVGSLSSGTVKDLRLFEATIQVNIIIILN